MPPRHQLVQCDSLRTLECEVESIREKLTIPESEESWETLAKAIIRFSNLIPNGASNFPEEVANGLRIISRPLNSAVLSERSRLSGAAIDLLKAAAEGIGRSFEAIIPLFLPTLLTLCSRSNKVFISRAKSCIITIIEATQAPTILSYLADAVKDKSLSLRAASAESGLACLNSFNPPDLEKETRALQVEALIRSTATDASADVRKISRQLFEAYKILLPHRVESFAAPLTPTTKKYLDIRTRAPSSQSNPSSRPPSSQAIHPPPQSKFPLPPSMTTVFSRPTGSGPTPANPPLRARTISTAAGSGLARSESAPSITKSTSVTTTSSQPIRPVVGPSRPKPMGNGPQKGPSRPVNPGDMPPPATFPVRPQFASASPSATSSSEDHNPFAPPETAAVVLKTSGGPLRPTPAQGPGRVPQENGEKDGATHKPRVVGGARRVLLPEPPVPPQVPPIPPIPTPPPKEAKQPSSSSHSRTGSNTSADPPAAPTQLFQSTTAKPVKTERAEKKPPPGPTKTDAKKNEKTEPAKVKPILLTRSATVASPNSRTTLTVPRRTRDPSTSTTTSHTSHTSRTTSRTTATTTAMTTATTSRRNATTTATTTSRLTEPTQSQLAKTKAPTKPLPTKKNEVAKPLWGRLGGPSKPSAPAKTATGPNAKKRVVSTAARPNASVSSKSDAEVVAAASVPLPPSPVQASSPLPDNEEKKAEDVELPGLPIVIVEPIVIVTPEESGDAEVEGEHEGERTIIQHSPTEEEQPDPQQQSPATTTTESSTFSLPPDLVQIHPTTPKPSTPPPAFPALIQNVVPETPITSLLESIQRGFDFSPAQFDPDQTYSCGGLVTNEDSLAVGERKPLAPIT